VTPTETLERSRPTAYNAPLTPTKETPLGPPPLLEPLLPVLVPQVMLVHLQGFAIAMEFGRLSFLILANACLVPLKLMPQLHGPPCCQTHRLTELV